MKVEDIARKNGLNEATLHQIIWKDDNFEIKSLSRWPMKIIKKQDRWIFILVSVQSLSVQTISSEVTVLVSKSMVNKWLQISKLLAYLNVVQQSWQNGIKMLVFRNYMNWINEWFFVQWWKNNQFRWPRWLGILLARYLKGATDFYHQIIWRRSTHGRRPFFCNETTDIYTFF